MSYLVDSNVFLEILLGQPNKGRCKQFLPLVTQDGDFQRVNGKIPVEFL